MNNKQQISLSLILSKALFYSFVNNLLFNVNYIIIILSYVIGYLLLRTIIKYKLNTKYIKLIISICLFIFTLISLIRQVHYFYLNNTPFIIISFSFVLVLIYGASKHNYTIYRLSEILLYLDILLMILGIAFNLPNYNFNFLCNNDYIIIPYIVFFSISPLLLLDFDYKNILKGYFLGSILNILVLISTSLTLNNTLLKLYEYKEYMAFKKIQIVNFISRLENIISLFSLMDLTLLGIMTIKSLKDYLNKKIVIPLVFSITIIISIFI